MANSEQPFSVLFGQGENPEMPKETPEEARARVEKNIRRQMIETAAEKEFPYLMQDPELHNAVCEHLDAHQPTAENAALEPRTLKEAARSLHHDLIAISSAHYNRCRPLGRNESDVPQALLELFPAYQQMAREAAADDNRFAVKYLGSANKKLTHGDCWKDRVAELRDITAQRG